MQVTFPCRSYAAPPCVDLAQENEAHMRLNGSFIWDSQLPDWAGTDFHQPSLCTNVTVNVSRSPQTCLWNWVIHFSVFWGYSFVNQNRVVIEVFYIQAYARFFCLLRPREQPGRQPNAGVLPAAGHSAQHHHDLHDNCRGQQRARADQPPYRH